MKKIYYLFAIMTLSACESPLDELTRSPFSDDASPCQHGLFNSTRLTNYRVFL